VTVHAWRIIKAKHAAAAFSGDAARKYGGRWNSPGTAVVYAAGSVSLAILETVVHLQSHELLERYLPFELAFDAARVITLDPVTLPKTWRSSPPPPTIQHIGDAWVAAAGSPVLRVPSVIVPAEWNYVLNPSHPAFAKTLIGPKQRVHFDPRLIKPPMA
jgi:RES domain-containing protein